MQKAEENLVGGDGLLVIDIQRDFCPGGALPIAGGDLVVPVINGWIAAAVRNKVPIYYSRDWHPRGHPSFKKNGGDWPEHCVQDTPGAAFHPALDLVPDPVVISKGSRFDQNQLSVFNRTGFADKLRLDGVKRLWLAGLALDVCVLETALDGVRAGFKVAVVVEGCRPVTGEGGRQALDAMRRAGVYLTTDN
ncbi:MAG: isochorismatase family protein [Syntrophotalea acetylenica]|uniref:nicotinamidase n=1 Tax=Syntrophotalea acetylenica TaxID=29542 RepID=A0A1L3GIE9_SYNAC|nr:isochorismatase family protein [Syntrophotalea acetylenica]APG25655.1 nicotinamidase [Syntrophotalea acetylenica]APG43728.1 nicotinamidase [Syntrophotalea acetylenica]MDD4457383.1 isochorismatase family protein [Syntrophotalea acetylenica]